MQNFFIGLLAIAGIIILLIIIVSMIGLISYGFGWSVGWFMHLFIGPDIIFGIQFEQVVSLLTMVLYVLGVSFWSIQQQNNKKIDKIIKTKLKEYRGY